MSEQEPSIDARLLALELKVELMERAVTDLVEGVQVRNQQMLDRIVALEKKAGIDRGDGA